MKLYAKSNLNPSQMGVKSVKLFDEPNHKKFKFYEVSLMYLRFLLRKGFHQKFLSLKEVKDMYWGFGALLILAGIHLFANRAQILGWIWKGHFLSFAAGISFAYVFIDLLPELEKGQSVLKRSFGEILPYLDRHTYVIALLGVLFYYGLHTQSTTSSNRNFWISLSGYWIFNFFVGASLSDGNNPEIQPLLLFTIAMGMHYFIVDHNANEENGALYNQKGRWFLVLALFFGYIVGYLTSIPDTVVAITVSFISGGVLLNVLRYELPKREQIGYYFFLMGSLIFTLLILNLNYIQKILQEGERDRIEAINN